MGHFYCIHSIEKVMVNTHLYSKLDGSIKLVFCCLSNTQLPISEKSGIKTNEREQNAFRGVNLCMIRMYVDARAYTRARAHAHVNALYSSVTLHK